MARGSRANWFNHGIQLDMVPTDGGSSGEEHLASQPGDGGSNPTPPLKSYRAHLVPRSEIKDFIEKWHYSGSVDGVNSTYCFDFRDPEGKLVGAIILGRPAAGAGRTNKYGDRVIEIRRLCCVDSTPKNAESRFIGYVLRWLKGKGYDAVLAYSDLEHGHEGGIYAASNFKRIRGIPGAARVEWNGKSYHDRSLRKIEGRLKPFSRRLAAAIRRGETRLRRTKGKTVWLYRWEPPARRQLGQEARGMAAMSGRELDAKGEAARRLYKRMVSAAKDYNAQRRAQTESLRKALSPVWAALGRDEVVNGCKDKLSWCRWANPTAKHPERWFYKLMRDPELNSVQPKPKNRWVRPFPLKPYAKIEVDTGDDAEGRMWCRVHNITYEGCDNGKNVEILRLEVQFEGRRHVLENDGPLCKASTTILRGSFNKNDYLYAEAGEKPNCTACLVQLERYERRKEQGAVAAD